MYFSNLAPKNLFYYFYLALTFVVIIGISNFQHKTLLFFSPWFFFAFSKEKIKSLREIIEQNQALTIISIALSIDILISTYINNGAAENHLIALVFTTWIPIAACHRAAINQEGQKAYVKLYIVFLLAQLLISSTLIWQKFFIGSPRPLGIGHNVISGPLICICAITLFEIACKFSSEKTLWAKNIYSGISVIFILASTATGSRTGLFCAATAILFIIIRSFTEINKKWLFATLAIIAGIAYFNGNRVQEVFTDINNYKSGHLFTSSGSRIEAIRWAKQNIDKSIITGISVENVEKGFNSRYRDQNIPAEYLPHLHNDFLQLSMAFGPISAILFLCYIYAYYKYNPSLHKKYVVICLLIVSLFDSLTYNTEALIAFLGILAVNIALQISEKKK